MASWEQPSGISPSPFVPSPSPTVVEEPPKKEGPGINWSPGRKIPDIAIYVLVVVAVLVVVFSFVCLYQCIWGRDNCGIRARRRAKRNADPRIIDLELQPQHPRQVTRLGNTMAPDAHPHPDFEAQEAARQPRASSRERYNARVRANLANGSGSASGSGTRKSGNPGRRYAESSRSGPRPQHNGYNPYIWTAPVQQPETLTPAEPSSPRRQPSLDITADPQARYNAQGGRMPASGPARPGLATLYRDPHN